MNYHIRKVYLRLRLAEPLADLPSIELGAPHADCAAVYAIALREAVAVLAKGKTYTKKRFYVIYLIKLEQ